MLATFLAAFFIATIVAARSSAATQSELRAREKKQVATLHRVTGTVVFFRRHPWLLKYGHHRETARRELRRARIWVRIVTRELAETRAALQPDWAALQIAAATVIGRESGGDPWPNCPDPFDGGGSWFDTVKCENKKMFQLYGFPRAWLDSPGYFRCGLQFDPGWERRFGRLCP